MKKLFRTLAVLTFASAAFLTSCDKEDSVEDVTVNISASPSDPSLALGKSLKLTLELKGNDDNKLKNVTVTTNLGSSKSAPLLNEKLSGTEAVKVVDVVLDEPGAWVITVLLEGEEGTKTGTYNVTVTAPSNYKGLDLGGSELLLGAQAGTIPQFINISSGTTYEYGSGAAKNNSPEIDLGFAFGTGDVATRNAATLFGPAHTAYHNAIYNDPINGIAKWAVKNATKIVKLATVNATDYEAALNDSIIIYNAGKLPNTAENRVTKLAEGDVLLFETARNIGSSPKRGLILITNIDVKPTSGTVGTQTEIKFKRKIEQ